MKGADASKVSRRVHLSVLPGERAGTMIVHLSSREPASSGAIAALISRGMLMGETVDLTLVTDGSKDPALKGDKGDTGADGKSAYDIARELGYGGTKTQWLTTLVGAPGRDGTNGRDAATIIGSVTLAESNLLNISAGVRRRVIATSFDLPTGATLFLLPKAPPPAGYIVQAAWALKTRELTVDLTTPAITLLGGYSIDCWLLRLNA